MSLLGDRTAIEKRTPMPTNDMTVSTDIVQVTGETVAITAGAAGTAVVSVLDKAPVYDSLGGRVGNNSDSSFAWVTGTCFTTERKIDYNYLDRLTVGDRSSATKVTAMTAGWANGDFAVDYENGIIYGVKATAATSDTVNYKTRAFQVVLTATGGGGTTLVDDAAFGVASSNVTPIGFLADETTPDSVNEGDVGAARITLDRKQITAAQLVDDTAFGVTTGYVGVVGMLADETAADSVDEGDIGAPRMTLNRRQIIAGQTLDDAAFGVGTEYANATGFLADETAADSVDEGDIGIARMTLDRKQINASEIVDDTAFTPATSYTTVMGAQADETGTDSVDEGDAGALRMTLARKLITSSEFQEDTAHSSADYGTHVLSVFKTTAAQQAGTDGDYAPLLTNSTGHLHNAEGFAPQAEDNTNGVIATQNKPLAVTTYAWSVDRSTALEASSIAKATAGVIRGASGRIDSTQAGGTYYIQLLNSATLPADGAVTTLVAPLKIQHTLGTDSLFNIDCTQNGVYASAGIVIVLSTSEFSKTISGAYMSSTVTYI